MRAVRAFFIRLSGVVTGGRRDREVEEEFQTHLDMQIEDHVRAGMAAEEARRAALLASGGLDLGRELCRDRRSLPSIEALLRDLRYTARLCRRNPGFTATAVLLLALGTGANSAIFTLIDRVVLKRLPVNAPDQLVMIWTTGPSLGGSQGGRASSYPMYQDFQQRAGRLSHVFCRYVTPLSVAFGDHTDRVTGELVSGNYFRALGVGPAVGRVFSSEEDDRVYKGHPVVVLSHQYWVDRFGANPGVVGKTILVNGYPMVVVGVSAAGFTGLDPTRSPHIRVPIQMKPLMTPGSDQLGNRRNQWIQMFGRLEPGETAASAQAALQPLLAQILRAESEDRAVRDQRPQVRDRFLGRQARVEQIPGGYSELRQTYTTPLVILMSMAGLALLTTCFNITSLLVARAAARQREIAVRIAIGASRGHLIRQLLVESTAITAVGAVIGLALSVVMIRVLLGFLPTRGMQLAVAAAPDWRVLVFTTVLSATAALVFGLAPAAASWRVDVSRSLRASDGGRRGRTSRLRNGLVVAQIALSFLLLAGAGLLVRTLGNLKQVSPGFRDIDGLMTFQVDAARSGYGLDRLQAFYRDVQAAGEALPGVTSVGYAWVPVLSGREADYDVVVEGRLGVNPDAQAFVNMVSPDYCQTMGLVLIDGRDFDVRDQGRKTTIAIVNRAFAEHFFGDQSPIGRHIGLFLGPGSQPDMEIVGLVENSLYEGPRQGVRRQVYLPFAQSSLPYAASFYVRTATPAAATYAVLTHAIQKLDPAMPIYEMKTLQTQLDETLGTERLTATLSAAFAGLATVLAAVGLYGVLALAVVRRTKEVGVRMALGASRISVLWMVLREALTLLAAGLAVGIPCAYAVGRYLSSQLFDVAPTDIRVAAAAGAILLAVTGAAALAPARRATAIDPIRALRHE